MHAGAMSFPTIGGSQFRCAVCHNVYAKGAPDDVAEVELLDSFPGFTTQECVLVCGDCWQGIRRP